MKCSAVFSDCRTFRYALSRVWDSAAQKVLFIGLNPSRADEKNDDPTIRRCVGFAKDWGFGGFTIVNLFAYCSHDSKDLYKVDNPVGPENDQMLASHIAENEKIVLIWGNNGHYLDRSQKVLELIEHPLCLKMNKNGAPEL